MGLDLENPENLYNELCAHAGHTIVIATYTAYTSDTPPANVAIECEDCGIVLLDQDNPEG